MVLAREVGTDAANQVIIHDEEVTMGMDLSDMVLMLLGSVASVPALYGIAENLGNRFARGSR